MRPRRAPCGTGGARLPLYGVEPDPRAAAWGQANAGVEVRVGLFPEVVLPPCDLFLALDVLEHVPDPAAFMSAASALLRPGGVAIIQCPTDRGGLGRPFGARFDQMFDDLEHLYLFTDSALQELGRRAHLTVLTQDEAWKPCHEVCVFRKR